MIPDGIPVIETQSIILFLIDKRLRKFQSLMR
jgi:hypothetical protein